MSAKKWQNDPAVKNFREYLQIESVHPDVDYGSCVEFLRRQAASLELPVQVVEVAPRKPIVIITWKGQHPELPSIMLNSHMDVVPVFEKSWSHPPFAAHITDDGWIYARGTQDMKVVGIQHLEAVRRLKAQGKNLRRTVHVTFVPDEEIGSKEGMRLFVKTPEFVAMNVGFELDESMPSGTVDENKYVAFYGERITLQYKITCPGIPGHGSSLPSGTAGEKLLYVIDKFMTFRAEELRKKDAGKWLGEVTSVNLTKIEGGVQLNVLPEELIACFDVRLAMDVDVQEFENRIKTWCRDAGNDVRYEYLQWNPVAENTKLDHSNPFWIALKNSLEDIGVPALPVICPGSTDARYLRLEGIPAIGLSLIRQAPLLLHAHDERIHVDEFLTGIDHMEKIIAAVANV